MMTDTPRTDGIKACILCGETTRVIRANGLCCHCDFERLSKIPTPRTNVVIMQCHSAANVVRAYMKMLSHAEQLERELAAMTKRADEMERLKEQNADMFYRVERELADLKAQHAWRPIETAPKDGTEILVYLPTCGALLARWIAPCEFLTEDELDGIVNPEESDWFCADFIQGGRLTDGQPTHWKPLPEPPKGCAE